MIQLDHVTFCYEGNEKPSLSDCSLTIPKGQFILLCGKSGCGKTTLTKLLNGLIPSQVHGDLSGHVYMEGKDITNQPIWKTSLRVGSVFQNPKTQFFNLDTTNELVFGLENEGVCPDVIRDRLEHVVEEYSLEPLAGKSVFELSGGEKQKIAIASAYMGNPSIYVLDEPSANLDQVEILRLQELLKRLKQEGKTVVIAEHRAWYLAELLDRAVFLEDGKAIKDWTHLEFQKLSDEERERYGLRGVRPVKMKEGTNKQSHGEGLMIQSLCVKRNKHILWEYLSFFAPRGKAVAILGKNGAGKTTLAQCLCGLRKFGTGEIYLDGKKMTARELRKNSFLIMQDVNHQLFAASVLAEAKLGNDVSDEKVMVALENMQLDEFIETHPMALSGGQKQRLAVIDGSLCSKEIILFDEPTSGLDFDNMRRVGTLIQTLLKKNKVVIVITHDLEFINLLNAIVIS